MEENNQKTPEDNKGVNKELDENFYRNKPKMDFINLRIINISKTIIIFFEYL